MHVFNNVNVIIFCYRYVASVAYGINISHQSSTKMTPFYLMNLRHPRDIEALNQLHDGDDETKYADVTCDENVHLENNLVNLCVEVEKIARENIDITQQKQSINNVSSMPRM